MDENNINSEVTNDGTMQEVTEKQIEEFKEQLDVDDSAGATPPLSPMTVVKGAKGSDRIDQSNDEQTEQEKFLEEEKNREVQIEQEIKKYPKPVKLPYVGYMIPMKRMEISELFQLFVKLGKVPNTEPGGKWGYFVIRNAQKCRSIMRVTDKRIQDLYPAKEDPREKEYRDLEFKLFEEFSQKDPNGNPVMEGRNFKIKEESKILFDERMNELRRQYKDVMDTYKSMNEKSTKIGHEMIYFEQPYMIYSTHLPAGITPAEQEFLDAFIIEVE